MEDELAKDISDLKEKLPSEEISVASEELVQMDVEAAELSDLRLKAMVPATFPNEPVRLEANSKTLAPDLVEKLRSSVESKAEARAKEGKRHIAEIMEQARNGIKHNKLAPAFEELKAIEQAVPKGSLTINQKGGEVKLTLECKGYYLKFSLEVPPDYPISKPKYQTLGHNFPKEVVGMFEAQALEIAKKYEEGNITVDEARMIQQAKSSTSGSDPARRSPSATTIQVPPGPAGREDSSMKANSLKNPDSGRPPKYSVAAIVKYLKEEFFDKLTLNKCPVCDKSILPADPKNAERIPEKQKPEHLYCGSWYHYKCLEEYIKTPPFKGGKTCLECGRKIVHPKLPTDEKELQRKWNQKQATKREVEETKDAMGL